MHSQAEHSLTLHSSSIPMSSFNQSTTDSVFPLTYLMKTVGRGTAKRADTNPDDNPLEPLIGIGAFAPSCSARFRT
jgi:hypothetical protein